MNINETIDGTREYAGQGDFFRLLDTSGPVDVRFYRKGSEVSRAEGIAEGYAEHFREPFDRVAIITTAPVVVAAVVRDGAQVSYDKPPNGDVTITNTAGAFTHTAASVGVASGQVLAANAARRYLLLQNLSAADIHVRLDGAAATVGGAIKLSPGASYEAQGYAPTGAVVAIASAAASSLHVVEG